MMIRKKLAVLMLTGVTCLASGCGNVVKDGTEALGEGRYDAAETAFEEATKNGNKEVAADGYQGLGMTYYEQEEYDKALEAFQTALDQGAEQTQELYNLTAVCAMKTEDYAKALECSRLESHLQKARQEMTKRKQIQHFFKKWNIM